MPCQEDALASSIKAFDQVDDVNVEITRLRMLSDIMETYKMLLGAKRALPTQNPLEYCYHALQVRLGPLQPADPERQLIHRYFFGGLRSYDRHRYRISNVFEVERRGETQRFNDFMEERQDLKTMQTHLLWHGTRRSNLMGILSQGLRVAPPSSAPWLRVRQGMYFANVAEKSLNYCDGHGKPDKTTAKTREVHYMLLCECTILIHEVRSCHRSVELCYTWQVKQVGIELPYDRVWAKTEPNPTPMGWYERNPKFTAETQDYLSKLVADESFAVGNTHTVSTTGKDREHFVQYQYDQRTIVIELVSRETPDATEDDDEADVAPQKAGSGACYSYSTKLYRNTLKSSPLAEGFTLVEPALSEYAELVVYKEAQARIRYVVEVETV
ncbi:Poly(ADP-ribose) polymerase, catalytic domain [Phytophthora cactorum]|nr:Poly(ADP-ribose) polymerase, catalytic domain [Phytophthora cactorum]